MKTKKILIGSIMLISVVMVPLVMLSGCGGGGGGSAGSDSGSSPASGSYVGITECYGCHADGVSVGSAAGIVAASASCCSTNIFSIWKNGPHGNYEGTDYAGSPSFADLTGSGCSTCHDELGDGMLLDEYYLRTGISFLGTVDRPVVGCESCHGSGGNHFGIGAIPYAAPGADICGNCHDDNTHVSDTYVTDYLESGSIYTDYLASPHAGSINSEIYAAGSTTDSMAACSKCHTDEGAREYKDISGGYSTLLNYDYDSDSDTVNETVADVNAVQCRTCHDAHDPSRLLMAATTGQSAEYNTCTNCHQVIEDSYHGKNNPGSWSGGAVDSGSLDTEMIIYDSHFDDSTTADIEGYNIDPSNSRACRDCHNQHNADKTINVEWANSSHGGFILRTTQDSTTHKYEVTEDEGPAFVHYDFKAENRQACQRCHTATGFRNMADGPSAYDPVNNDFSYLTDNQREMLYCWACHTSNVGDLRSPGQFVRPDSTKYAYPSGRSIPTNIAGSYICVNCHSGRQTGQYIKDLSSTPSSSFSNYNPHYLADGGILFRTIGYEFSDLDYSNVTGFAHASIGTGEGSDGDQGPCVGCHMLTDDDHTNHELEPVEKDDDGDVINIKVYTKVCSRCHDSESTLISTLNTRDTQYNAALDALQTQLANDGIYYCGDYHPYFWKNSASCTDSAKRTSSYQYMTWANLDTLGAAFNFNLLKHIPVAYAHNREYVRRLLYDSIDFLDDDAHNGSVEDTLGGEGNAFDYLNGTR
ncbi:MAG: hypothetical protein HZA16_08780 [Nitrospirae bacterium]|nr:hypothetical protein [Nitrospirota bacterium]